MIDARDKEFVPLIFETGPLSARPALRRFNFTHCRLLVSGDFNHKSIICKESFGEGNASLFRASATLPQFWGQRTESTYRARSAWPGE